MTNKEKLSELGIELKLTDDGVDNLVKIMYDGCPINTFQGGGFEPISCQLFFKHPANRSCKSCWRRYLKKFKEEDANVSANG